MLIPGPVELSEKTRAEAGRQMVPHRGAEFKQVLAGLGKGIGEIIGTAEKVHAITGSGTAAVEFLAANLIRPGDRVACLANGKFGKRFAEIASIYSENTLVFAAEGGNPLEYEPIEADVVTVVHNETSTGVLNGLKKVRADFPHALLIVDAVSGIGNPLSMEGMGIDGMAIASQKALAAPPGLAFASLSGRAARKAMENPGKPPYYLDYRRYAKAAEKNETPFTPVESVVFAAASRVKEILGEGMPRFVERHAANADFVRQSVKKTGLSLLAKNGAIPSNVVTAVETPAAEEIRAKARERGFVFAGGQDELKGKIFRVAHMGETTREELAQAMGALGQSVEAAGRGNAPEPQGNGAAGIAAAEHCRSGE